MISYTLGPARYARGMMALSAPSDTGFKTRAARLAERLANGRYTNREKAYILRPSAATKFERLYAAGWDACIISGDLIEPAPDLLGAARRLLDLIDNMTSDEFARGEERLEREELRRIIAAVSTPR